MTEITVNLVEKLIKEQFPQWKDLEIRPVEKSGHDNRTFYLGDDMTVRLPSGREYAAQVEKEMRWLPYLGERLALPVSAPVAQGRPCEEFPFPWSVNRYLPGRTALEENVGSSDAFAEDLASFLRELQGVETDTGPAAGRHNFFRGGDLKVYDGQTKEALKQWKKELPIDLFAGIWQQAISSRWEKSPVWVHGDVAPGNLLVKEGRLSGVIDFGVMGVGDPACDYAMAWTYFDEKRRDIFLNGQDREMKNRARGWALWKALITYRGENQDFARNAEYTLKSIAKEEGYTQG